MELIKIAERKKRMVTSWIPKEFACVIESK